MKRKKTGIGALILTAALVLSACGASPQATAEEADDSGALSSETRDSGTENDGNQRTEIDASAAEQADSLLFEDVFSSRDLSGDWDADAAVLIALEGGSISCDSESVTVTGTSAVITDAGTYRAAGTLENGSLIVDAGKDDKIQIVLDNAAVHADTFAALYVKQADKVFLTLADGTVNALSNGGTFEAVDENDVDGAVFSKDDLTLNGAGKLVITSPAGHGIVSKDDLTAASGTYEITSGSHALSANDSVAIADGLFTLQAGKDGIHADNDEDSEKGYVYLAGGTVTVNADSDGISASSLLQVDGGTLDITAAEGMEGHHICVNDGTIRIQASDDGINAGWKSGTGTPSVTFNGGDITVAVGQGDTDCVDSNGTLTITGGTIRVTGNSGFDADGTVTFTGGTVIINGEQVDSIPVQMGGRGGFGGMGGMGGTNGQDGMNGQGGGFGGFNNRSSDAFGNPEDGMRQQGRGRMRGPGSSEGMPPPPARG